MTSFCFDGRFASDGSGSGKASIADHSWSINTCRSPTLLRFSTPGSAFHNAKSRLPVSGAACNSSFEATAISPSFTVAGASRHSVIPSLPMMYVRMGGGLLIDPAGAAGDPTHALFADQSHSIPDNLVALLGHSRAWNCSAENRVECGGYWSANSRIPVLSGRGLRRSILLKMTLSRRSWTGRLTRAAGPKH